MPQHESDEPGRSSSSPSDMQKLLYLNTVLMANLLLRRLKIPLYIHVDHERNQLSVVADDGSALTNSPNSVYTRDLDYVLDDQN